jgi:hypothetical protein
MGLVHRALEDRLKAFIAKYPMIGHQAEVQSWGSYTLIITLPGVHLHTGKRFGWGFTPTDALVSTLEEVLNGHNQEQYMSAFAKHFGDMAVLEFLDLKNEPVVEPEIKLLVSGSV